MLKKNRNGLGDRHEEMDKYVEAQKFKKVKKYSEFIHD